MIDFVRVHYSDKSILETFVMENETFESVITNFQYRTSEILYPYKANLGNMEIVINERGGYVKNSLHKLNNLLLAGDGHNYNDFPYSQLCSSIDYMSDNIIDVNEKKITQLEFGLNISGTKKAETIIKKSILMHNLERHTALRKFKGRGYLLEFEHANYIIKVYDKAKQYRRPENTLRFEIKFTSTKEFNPLGVYNLEDLKSKENLENLLNYMLKRFDELLIVDDITKNRGITARDFDDLNIYSSFAYWSNLSDNNQRQKKMIDKRKYHVLLEKYDLLKTKRTLRALLVEKFEELINK
jgi:hypothetical protein